MNEIYERRSIRRYKAVSVAQEVIEQILRAGVAAPSSKNRQPWRFIVETGTAKETALLAMEKGLGREKTNPLLPESAEHLPAAWHTLEVMKTAPVVVFIINPLAKPLGEKCLPRSVYRTSAMRSLLEQLLKTWRSRQPN